jgi:hypothetical protein
MFAAQELARFKPTKELMPLLEASPAGRVIRVAGGKRALAYDDLNSQRAFSALGAVLQTSVANRPHCIELRDEAR